VFSPVLQSPRNVPASLARAVLGVSHVVLADSGSADERLLLAIQKPEVTDVGTNSVRVGCHLVGWLRGCVVARLSPTLSMLSTS